MSAQAVHSVLAMLRAPQTRDTHTVPPWKNLEKNISCPWKTLEKYFSSVV
jgi:hypothetical protein